VVGDHGCSHLEQVKFVVRYYEVKILFLDANAAAVHSSTKCSQTSDVTRGVTPSRGGGARTD